MSDAAVPRVLLVGDLIIDRSWLVNAPRAPVKHEAPYEVSPQRMASPLNLTDVAGGVGTTARALASLGNADVTLVSAWGEDVNLPAMFPEEGNLAVSRIALLRAATCPFTTMKWRVYTAEPTGPVIQNRYDRNLDLTNLTPSAIEWPSLESTKLVVINDHNYGLMDLSHVAAQIRVYEGRPILIRCRRLQLLRELPWTVFSVTLRTFSRLVGRHEPFDTPVVKQGNHGFIFHPDLVSTLDQFATDFLGNDRSMLLRVGTEGALLVRRDSLTPFLVGGPTLPWFGVGAGDVLLAHLAEGYLRDEDLIGSCKAAVAASAAFGHEARQIEKDAGLVRPATLCRRGEARQRLDSDANGDATCLCSLNPSRRSQLRRPAKARCKGSSCRVVPAWLSDD